MKVSALTSLLLVLVTAGISQTASADSDPVLQGSASYSLPQSALDAEIDGSVTVAIRVDESGKPTKAVLFAGPMWPCGANPLSALEELSSTLSEAMMQLRFSPAIKDGKPITKNVGLKVALKNPKLAPEFEIDPATGKRVAKQINGGVLNGKATVLPKPDYPAEARANLESGPVKIQILIDEDGKVGRAGTVDGGTTLHYAAREAACAAKFTPTTLSGRPVRVSGVLTYNFIR